jgi:hypothetical protein
MRNWIYCSTTIVSASIVSREALQRNAKPRKGYDFGYPKVGLYAAKHEGQAFKHL